MNSAAGFAQTRWSLVAAAGGAHGEPGHARRALVELCLRYWYPVYAYVRGCGHDASLARDITRGFFEQVVHDRLALPAERARGRFRDWLLDSLNRFLGGDWREAMQAAPVPEFEQPQAWETLEARYRDEAAAGRTPEQRYQRGYAMDVLAHALARLRNEAAQAGRADMFAAFEPWLGSEPAPGEVDAAARALGLRPLSAVLALKRLRQRFRELAEAELGETVANADDLASERDALARALGPG